MDAAPNDSNKKLGFWINFWILRVISATGEAAVGPIALAKNIVKTEGPKGLYRGIGPNFMKVKKIFSV